MCARVARARARARARGNESTWFARNEIELFIHKFMPLDGNIASSSSFSFPLPLCVLPFVLYVLRSASRPFLFQRRKTEATMKYKRVAPARAELRAQPPFNLVIGRVSLIEFPVHNDRPPNKA